ncbi:hypothetical protein [Candidatus Cyrtobacter comes]|uniref:hypothetical protein n=1 Tax=Candidatus Cyrtobacter comes TaxID=675776 RepID=UPI002ACE13DD|nr:hypothetical protein [Candidatus Cyrtobacter comes]
MARFIFDGLFIDIEALENKGRDFSVIGYGLGLFFPIYLGHLLALSKDAVQRLSVIVYKSKQYRILDLNIIFALITWCILLALIVFCKYQYKISYSITICHAVYIVFVVFCILNLCLHFFSRECLDYESILHDLFDDIATKDLVDIENFYKVLRPKVSHDPWLASKIINFSPKILSNNKDNKFNNLQDGSEMIATICEIGMVHYKQLNVLDFERLLPLYGSIKSHSGREKIVKVMQDTVMTLANFINVQDDAKMILLLNNLNMLNYEQRLAVYNLLLVHAEGREKPQTIIITNMIQAVSSINLEQGGGIEFFSGLFVFLLYNASITFRHAHEQAKVVIKQFIECYKTLSETDLKPEYKQKLYGATMRICEAMVKKEIINKDNIYIYYSDYVIGIYGSLQNDVMFHILELKEVRDLDKFFLCLDTLKNNLFNMIFVSPLQKLYRDLKVNTNNENNVEYYFKQFTTKLAEAVTLPSKKGVIIENKDVIQHYLCNLIYDISECCKKAIEAMITKGGLLYDYAVISQYEEALRSNGYPEVYNTKYRKDD